MDEFTLKCVVEALLMSAKQPLSMDKLLAVFDDQEKPTREQLTHVLAELKQDYTTRAIDLNCTASGYCIQTKSYYGAWVARLFAEKPTKYSRALLETLTIIAYKQPVTRADIENIRGVAVSTSILQTLLEREWIRVAGHRDLPGKPAIYITTKVFLDYFNLYSLNDLPAISAEATQTLTECE